MHTTFILMHSHVIVIQ